jgi:hypothetical protein
MGVQLDQPAGTVISGTVAVSSTPLPPNAAQETGGNLAILASAVDQPGSSASADVSVSEVKMDELLSVNRHIRAALILLLNAIDKSTYSINDLEGL